MVHVKGVNRGVKKKVGVVPDNIFCQIRILEKFRRNYEGTSDSAGSNSLGNTFVLAELRNP